MELDGSGTATAAVRRFLSRRLDGVTARRSRVGAIESGSGEQARTARWARVGRALADILETAQECRGRRGGRQGCGTRAGGPGRAPEPCHLLFGNTSDPQGCSGGGKGSGKGRCSGTRCRTLFLGCAAAARSTEVCRGGRHFEGRGHTAASEPST